MSLLVLSWNVKLYRNEYSFLCSFLKLQVIGMSGTTVAKTCYCAHYILAHYVTSWVN